jgi:hypothetical protein
MAAIEQCYCQYHEVDFEQLWLLYRIVLAGHISWLSKLHFLAWCQNLMAKNFLQVEQFRAKDNTFNTSSFVFRIHSEVDSLPPLGPSSHGQT